MNGTSRTEILFPARILEASKNIRGAERLLVPRVLQVSSPDSEVMVVHGRGHVILDFGRELCGSVRILTEMPSGGERRAKLFKQYHLARVLLKVSRKGRIRIRLGESVTETCTDLGRNGAGDEHSLRDIKTRLVRHSDCLFFSSGFRFVRIDFREAGTCRIRNIVAVGSIFEAPRIYGYRGGDPLVKEIFDVARRTVDLCAGSGLLWDGIKRDRLVWIGDMFPEVVAMTTLYGRQEVIEHSLRFVRDRTPLGERMRGGGTSGGDARAARGL